jgi:Glycosyltransferase family 87
VKRGVPSAEHLAARVEADPLRHALAHGLAILAVAVPIWVLVLAARAHSIAVDFRGAFLPGAHAVLHGVSPYGEAGSKAVAEGIAFLYPPLTAYLLAPFTLLPSGVSGVLAVALVAATVPATLLALEVRDWRCYACAFLWFPVVFGIQTANVTLPLVLGLALVWRYRNRRAVGALVAGLVIAVKLFFWPVLVWLVATRRYRSAALAAAASVLLVLVPWAGIGFAGLRGYPHLLASVSRGEGPHSYSIAALLHGALPSWTAATALESVIGLAVLLLVVTLGRRARERDAFALTIVAVLLLTPLLEMHYLAVLLVVVGLYRRSFGAAWIAPLLIWGAPGPNEAALTQRVHVLVVVVATLVLAVSDWRPRLRSRSLRQGAEQVV